MAWDTCLLSTVVWAVIVFAPAKACAAGHAGECPDLRDTPEC